MFGARVAWPRRKRKRYDRRLAGFGVNVPYVYIYYAGCAARRDLHIDHRLRLTCHSGLLEDLAADHGPYLQPIGRLADKASQTSAVVELPDIVTGIGQQPPQHALLAKQW